MRSPAVSDCARWIHAQADPGLRFLVSFGLLGEASVPRTSPPLACRDGPLEAGDLVVVAVVVEIFVIVDDLLLVVIDIRRIVAPEIL
jgi:hypothetical protein